MKTLLGSGGSGGNTRVYLAQDCLEIEQQLPVDIVRRRIYLDDIVLVTLSHRQGWQLLLDSLLRGSIGGLLVFIGRLFSGEEVITVFGRRKKIEIVFAADKKPVQKCFQILVQAIQEKIAATNARLLREAPAEVLPDPGPAPEVEAIGASIPAAHENIAPLSPPPVSDPTTEAMPPPAPSLAGESDAAVEQTPREP